MCFLSMILGQRSGELIRDFGACSLSANYNVFSYVVVLYLLSFL